MRKLLLVLTAIALAFSACGQRRVGPMSPRRPDVPEHRGTKISAECLHCHDPATIKGHSRDDDCISCHFSIPGR